jgi:FixJ family two-component response regulator
MTTYLLLKQDSFRRKAGWLWSAGNRTLIAVREEEEMSRADWTVNLNQRIRRIGIVAIIDDDEDLREAVGSLLRASKFTIDTFPTAEAFLAFPRRDEVRCLVLDVRLPGMSGIELQKKLLDAGYGIPIVFISAHSDSSVRHLVMKAGAAAFLNKPVRARDLLHEIETALKESVSHREG